MKRKQFGTETSYKKGLLKIKEYLKSQQDIKMDTKNSYEEKILNHSMYSYELKDILLNSLTKENIYGGIYFKNDNNELFTINFVEFDKENNLILSKYKE